MNAVVLHNIGKLKLEEVPTPSLRPEHRPRPRRLLRGLRLGYPALFRKGNLSLSHHLRPRIRRHHRRALARCHRLEQGRSRRRVPAHLVRPLPGVRVGKYAQCLDYDYLGSRSDGGFRAISSSPLSKISSRPRQRLAEVAAMTEPAAVALHAIRRANTRLRRHRRHLRRWAPSACSSPSGPEPWAPAQILFFDLVPRQTRSRTKDGLHQRLR